MRRVHEERLDARRELAAAGFVPGFNSPGRPGLWVNLKQRKQRKAVARRTRDADQDWVVVDYPEPATCTPEEAIELAKRDGIVLNNGQLPVEGTIDVEFNESDLDLL